MSFWAMIKVIFTFLPELVGLIKTIIDLTSKGVQEIQIKKDIRNITKAFNNPNRGEAARELDDIFRN